jgi:hypothetical protein
MIELIAFEPSHPEHCAFLLKLGKESAGVLYGDFRSDPILMINEISACVDPETPRHFIAVKDGKPMGYIGAIVDIHKNGYIEGAVLKSFQSFYNARKMLLGYIQVVFAAGVIEKAKAKVPVFNLNAELVCRSVGFCKEGISKQDAIFNGRRVDVLELALFPAMIKQDASRHILKRVLNHRKKGR